MKKSVKNGALPEKPAELLAEEGDSRTSSMTGDWTEAEEKVVRNKIDWHVVPLVTILYLAQFLDRANIGNARIQGMEEELNLAGTRFNWALTVFYIPYLLVEVPSNVLLRYIGPKIYIPALVFAFGFISMCCAFVTQWQTLFVARAFLGICEGGAMPGIAFFLSCFYRRSELMFRVGFFVSSSSMAGAFGGLLATALSKIPRWGAPNMYLHDWRQIFFFEGIITMLLAIGGYFLMPSSPGQCEFLTARQQFIAAERINREHKENPKEPTTMWHVRHGLFNFNTILCAFGFFFANVTVQSFSLFLPTILKDLKWTNTKAQLMTVPPYVGACAWSILCSYLSDIHRRRGLYILLNIAIVIIGFSVLITQTRANIRYMAVFFSAMGAYPLGPFFLSWGLNNSAGPTVRAVSGGAIVSIGTCGALLATWTYVSTDAPLYIKGHSINLATEVTAAVLAIIGIIYVKMENKKRSSGQRDSRLEGLSEEEKSRLGYRHPDFRYME